VNDVVLQKIGVSSYQHFFSRHYCACEVMMLSFTINSVLACDWDILLLSAQDLVSYPLFNYQRPFCIEIAVFILCESHFQYEGRLLVAYVPKATGRLLIHP
jgi:hypothetical protein